MRTRAYRVVALVALVLAGLGSARPGSASESPRPDSRNGAGAARQEAPAQPKATKPPTPPVVRRVVTPPLVFVGADE